MIDSVTILVATANRPESLHQTLVSFSCLQRIGITLNVVVADNGVSPLTQEVIKDFRRSLQLCYWQLEEGYRSRAVNRAMAKIGSDIIIFTDDDVIPSAHWLMKYVALFRQEPNCVAACGPIIPEYPITCAKWIAGTYFETLLYARFQPDYRRGLLPVGVLPLGPNFAVRRSAIGDLGYREDLGPSRENGPLSCDDLGFVIDLRNRFMPLFRNGGLFYEPEAKVNHRIRSEQMSEEWIFDRFFNYGRSVVQLHQRPSCLRSPTVLTRMTSQPDEVELKLQSSELSFFLGQVCQLVRVGRALDAKFILSWLSEYGQLDPTIKMGEVGNRYRGTILNPSTAVS